jgi:hypothetical protein
LLPDKKILSGSKIVLSAGNGTVSAGKFVVSGDKVSDLTNLAAVQIRSIMDGFQVFVSATEWRAKAAHGETVGTNGKMFQAPDGAGEMRF